jgi:hypothetical protein
MALALGLADAFAVHRTADGPTIPAPGHFSPWRRDLGHGESVARFLSHAAQPNMRRFSHTAA